MTGWRVLGEIVVDIDHVDEKVAESATRQLDDALKDWGARNLGEARAEYLAGMITIEMPFRAELSYGRAAAQDEVVRMVTQTLEEFGLSSHSFHWTRVTPEPLYEES